MFSVLFNDPNLFGYVRNTWSLSSLAKYLAEELDISINQFQTSSKRILKDMSIRFKRQNWNLNMDQIMIMERRK